MPLCSYGGSRTPWRAKTAAPPVRRVDERAVKEQGRFRKLLSLKLGGYQAISWSQILRAEPRKEEKSLRNKRRGPPTFVAGRFWVLFGFSL